MKRWVGGEEDGACDERRDVYRAPVQPGGPRAEGLLPGEVKVTQSCPTLCDRMDCVVHGLSRPEHWRGEPFPSPGDRLSNIDGVFENG